MTRSRLDTIRDSIDANLPHLHSVRWAQRAADLRELVDRTTGAEQESARQALRDHYKTQHAPETIREALMSEAMQREAARYRDDGS